MIRFLPALAGLTLLGACANPTPQPREAIPNPPTPPVASAADPGRQAVIEAAYAFSDTSRLAGRPADAARAAADLEWMAVALPRDPRWVDASALVFPSLVGARDTLRRNLGIPTSLPSTTVVSGLSRASSTLAAGDRSAASTALAPLAPEGPDALLARLSALPQMPEVAAATRLAENELFRSARQRDPD